MDDLLHLISEYLVVPLLLFLVLGGEVVGTLLLGLAPVVVRSVERLRRRNDPRSSEPGNDSPPGPRRGRTLFRWVQRALVATLGVTLLGLGLANFFLLDGIVAWVTRRVELRTGTAITYAGMEGNLFTGAFRFSDIRVKRTTDDRAAFDLRVDHVAADLSVWAFLRGERTLDALTISGVDGTYVRPRPTEAERRTLRIAFTIGDAEQPLPPPRGTFFVRTLSIANGTILVEDRAGEKPITYPVTINSVSARPLRSHYLWWDLLFRSNLDLTIDHTKVVVENGSDNSQRHTVWSATDISAPVLASVVGGPLQVFTAGRVDVVARNSRQFRKDVAIDLHWSLTLRDARAAVPEELPPILSVPTRVFVEHVNARTDPWDLSFILRLHEGQFAGAASLDARQIWTGVTEAFLKEVVGLSATERESWRDGVRAGFERLKETLRKRNEEADAPAAEPEN